MLAEQEGSDLFPGFSDSREKTRFSFDSHENMRKVTSMKILMAASEMTPFARTGNLGDAVAALAETLSELGHEVVVLLPYYRCARKDFSKKLKRSAKKISVQLGLSLASCEILKMELPSGAQVFFVAHDEFFDRTELYGTDGRDYQDNSSRFIFFTKCAVELARQVMPDVVHVHGWQTALLPVFAKDQQMPFVTVLTPHTLEFQGYFWSYDFGLTNLHSSYFSPQGVEYYGSMNCLKAGILFSDAVVLPSRRYIAEAQTPEYGCGLENVLREHSHKLEGIPPGIGSFAATSGLTKEKSRAALLKQLKMEPSQQLFLAHTLAMQQRDVQILLEALDRLPSDDFRILLMGPVAEKNLIPLEVALRRHSGTFAYVPDKAEPLFHEVLTGADFFMIPGPSEPHAKLLMLALQNGVIPIAANCQGLWQFVQDFDPSTERGNGFIFYSQTTEALTDTFRRIAGTTPETLIQLAVAARTTDFSWLASAQRHISLYEHLLVQKGRPMAA